jgi:3-hydroxyisobutyrate dehydrogenase-like beta-hydroxyacid dehydrogenase
MRYVIAGSLGNISKPVSEKLLATGHIVTIFTSNATKRKAIEELGATAVVWISGRCTFSF